MSLKVVVHSASNLPDVDFSGHSDPFVVLSFQGRSFLRVLDLKNTVDNSSSPGPGCIKQQVRLSGNLCNHSLYCGGLSCTLLWKNRQKAD